MSFYFFMSLKRPNHDLMPGVDGVDGVIGAIIADGVVGAPSMEFP